MKKYVDMKKNENYSDLEAASEIIKNGGIVLFPTETVYGIGANALNDDAVKKIFIAKGREQDNPLILHISDMTMLPLIAEDISQIEYTLMERFFPGPFTIVLNKKVGVANTATCGGATVGVRMPSNKIAHELIKRAGVPIAAPSANISGRPSGTNIDDIFDELNEKVDYIVDGGQCEIGVESTVVRVIDGKVHILRPGKITKEDIEEIISNVELDNHLLLPINSDEMVLSPGMKYRHYAPKTKAMLIYGEDDKKVSDKINEVASKYGKPLVLAIDECAKDIMAPSIIKMGSKINLLEISHNIFSLLRRIDEYEADIAIIQGVKPEGIGLAIMNRLIRACEFNYYNVI